MSKTIGGPITPAGLGALLGDRPDRARQHARPHHLALRDAGDYLRRALSAIAAADVPDRVQAAELARMHARIADELVGLETLGKPL